MADHRGSMIHRESLNVDFDMSPIKKERLKKQKKETLRQKLRESLPVLSRQEIRRFRLPYHEALLHELTENGLVTTVEIITHLLELQEKTRRKLGPGTAIWLKPQLKESKTNLDIIAKSLKAAEIARKTKMFGTEWDEMLRLAAHFAFGSDDWWWIGEQILYHCMSLQNRGEHDKQEAISYFIIGKYLVENAKKTDAGKQYLDLARSMSVGKSWNSSKVLNKKQDILFVECCRLLCSALLEEALLLINTDTARAASICNVIKKRAVEACEHGIETEALLLRGRCESLLHKPDEAIATVTKVLHRTTRREDIKGICEAKIGLALAYLQFGKAQECLTCLKELKKLSEKHDLPLYTAQAYRFMGEYYMHKNQPSSATPMLMLAFYLFHESGDLKRREKVRTWAAIAAGEELFPAYITLLRKCDNTEEGRESLMTLISWIDEKQFFWVQETKFSFSFQSLRNTLVESQLSLV